MKLSQKQITKALNSNATAFFRHAGSDDIRAKGKVVAVANHPTYIIELEDGTQVSWAAQLCELEEVEGEE